MAASGERIGEVIGLIYEAGADSSLWPSALLAASELVGGQGGAFQMHRRRENVSSGIEVNFDPDISPEYFSYYQFCCPWIQAWFEKIRHNEVALGVDLCDRPTIEASEAYNDFYRRLDISDTCVLPFLVGENNAWANLNCGRRKGQFTEEDRAIAQILLPHFKRALGFQERFGGAFRLDRALSAALDGLAFPVFILDLQRRVVHANAAAAAPDGGVWKVALDRFSFADQEADQRLRAALVSFAGDAELRPLVINFVSERGGCAIVYPYAEQFGPFAGVGGRMAILYLPPPTGERPPLDAVLARFGLTAAEKEMVLTLLNGKSLSEYAEAHALSRETARWRSKQVFAKMGVRGQSDLMRALLTLHPPVALRIPGIH
jgi:DNA-binding CsgD family transcriptional regulator/PAS domain-containing protein